jgi:tRNA dimethylallyltransferase
MEVEVVSMDSRQIYRGMDVGTGKATQEERALVPHHGLDIRDPTERYSAGQFSRDCRRWIREIRGRGRIPLLVGGTGFFLRALTHPMFEEPPLDGDRLERLRAYLNGLERMELESWIRALDPEFEMGPSEGGRHRLTRHLEIALLTGRPLSWWHMEGEPSADPISGVIVVLAHPREALYARVNERVSRMVEEEGLVEEVRDLLAQGFRPADPGMTGAGYRETIAYLEGSLSLEEMVEEIRRAHRRYARRQITWFRHQLPGGAHLLDATQSMEGMVEEVLEVWKRSRGEASLDVRDPADTGSAGEME